MIQVTLSDSMEISSWEPMQKSHESVALCGWGAHETKRACSSYADFSLKKVDGENMVTFF